MLANSTAGITVISSKSSAIVLVFVGPQDHDCDLDRCEGFS